MDVQRPPFRALDRASGVWRIALVPAVTMALAPRAHGQEAQTEHTLKLAPGQASAKATIADMAWLAGR